MYLGPLKPSSSLIVTLLKASRAEPSLSLLRGWSKPPRSILRCLLRERELAPLLYPLWCPLLRGSSCLLYLNVLGAAIDLLIEPLPRPLPLPLLT